MRMDQLASVLLIIATAIFAASYLWLVIIAVRTRWWWLPAFFLVIPLFVFIGRERRKLHGVGLMALSSVVLLFGGLIVAGDLVRDRHPNEPPTRAFYQRALGCSGSSLWSQLLANQEKPLAEWLAKYTFRPDALTSELDIARQAVHIAALAYVPANEVPAITSSWAPAAQTTIVAVGPYQAVVIMTDDVAFVGFRGTDNAKNWVKNFKFLPAKTPLGVVHAGFMDAYRALQPGVMRALADAHDGSRPIWLTGHSLGGAIAMLQAVDLHEAKLELGGVVTFGQPPVGFANFADGWEASPPGRLLRFVNHRDAVPEITGPVALPWASLTHAGQLRYFDTTGALHSERPPLLQFFRDGACAQSFEANAEFRAHYMRRYLDLVLLASTRGLSG